jgi:heat shock protein HslJ
MMKTLVHSLLTLLGLAAVVAVSGGAASAQTGTLPADLLGTTWTLTAIQGPAQDLQDLSSAGVTLRFGDDGRASGQSTCNGYSATAQAGTASALTFGPILATKRACVEESRMTLETEYFNALQAVSSYTREGTQLRLNGPSTLTFSSAAAPPGMPVTGDPAPAAALAVLALAALGLVAGGLRLRRGLRPR